MTAPPHHLSDRPVADPAAGGPSPSGGNYRTCACCAKPIGPDDDTITDDDGYVFLEECWNP